MTILFWYGVYACGLLLASALIYITIRSLYTNARSRALQNSLCNISPENTIFAFDIHGVLFDPSLRDIVSIAWALPRKHRLAQQLLHPYVLKDLAGLIKKGAVAEEFIFELAAKHPGLQEFVPAGVAIANAQRPITPSIEVLNELHKKGYELHILSNIGPKILKELHQEHAEIFDLFSQVRVASPEDAYLRKPDARIYQDYLAQHNSGNKTVIFIDDKMNNISSALDEGIVGVPFTSAAELKKVLQQLHVL